MAEGFGKHPQVTKTTAETTRAKPRLSRIQWSKCEELGWSELTGIELVAAAGVRARSVSTLWCTGGRAGGGYGFLVLH